MRSAILAVAMLLAALFAVETGTYAAQDATSHPRAKSVELLMFEHVDCQYCRVFRRDVLPRYQESTQAARAPLRFVNIERSNIDGLGLASGIYMVPTFVVMRDGKEVDRIVGYWAPDNFFKMLAYILMKAE